MEMLQMDLEDNETTMNSFDGQVEELKGTVDALEAQLAQKQIQMSDMEAKLEESNAQVKLIFNHFNKINLADDGCIFKSFSHVTS